MANRPVFTAREMAPFFGFSNIEFVWNKGLANSQKQKNIIALHNAFMRHETGKTVLEISGKSMQEGGKELSAFSLKKYVPSLGKSIPVECVYQAGKVFQNGGPYTDLLEAEPIDAKRDERLKESGKITHFTFDGKIFPAQPQQFFYHYLYINALLENPELAEIVLKYDAFTDIVYNPEKSLNCQAKSAAVFVSLSKMGLLDKVKDPEEFLSLYKTKTSEATSEKKKAEAPKKEEPKIVIKAGNVIRHPKFGEGKVKAVEDGTVLAEFPGVGEKSLGMAWCRMKCEVIS